MPEPNDLIQWEWENRAGDAYFIVCAESPDASLAYLHQVARAIIAGEWRQEFDEAGLVELLARSCSPGGLKEKPS